MAYARMTEEEREKSRAQQRKWQLEREEEAEKARIKYEHERSMRFQLLAIIGAVIATVPMVVIMLPCIVIAAALKFAWWVFLGLAEFIQEMLGKMWEKVSP